MQTDRWWMHTVSYHYITKSKENMHCLICLYKRKKITRMDYVKTSLSKRKT